MRWQEPGTGSFFTRQLADVEYSTNVSFYAYLISLLALVSAPLHAVASSNNYSIWSVAVRGDVRSVGMAGATTGLADDYFGAVENPAGPAFTLDDFDVQINSANIHDRVQMDSGTSFTNFTTGIALPLDGMGTSFGYSIPFEGTGVAGEEIRLREYRLTFSMLFFKNRLSLGAGVAMATLELPLQTINKVRSTFGVLYRFPKRIFIGASFSPSSVFGPDFQGRNFSLPLLASVGTSWIPNRSFRAGLSLRWIGAESNVFRFHTPDEAVGTSPATQIHMGAAYEFMSFKNIYANLFCGSYLETTRSTVGSRLHSTAGLEIQPWFINLSAGIDTSTGYRNYQYAVGVDVGEVLRKFHLYPNEVPAPPAGMFARPFEVSDDWLPTQIQDHPEEAFQTINAELEDFTRIGKKPEIPPKKTVKKKPREKPLKKKPAKKPALPPKSDAQ